MIRSNIDSLAYTDGVLAVGVYGSETSEHRGAEHLSSMLDSAREILDRAYENSRLPQSHFHIRVSAGDVTIIAQREGDEVAVVAIHSRHAIDKSIHRLIRSLASRRRPNLDAVKILLSKIKEDPVQITSEQEHQPDRSDTANGQ